MIEKKNKRIWVDLGSQTNEGFAGGLQQMWVGAKGMVGKQAGEADTGMGTLRAKSGKMVSRSKRRRGKH